MNTDREEALEILYSGEIEFDNGGSYSLPQGGNEFAYIVEGYTAEHPFEIVQINIRAGSQTSRRELTEEEAINLIIEDIK